MAKKIRGVSTKKYAQLMHQIELNETTEAELVASGVLRPSTRLDNRAINKHRDNRIFRRRSKKRGRRSKDNECLVPHCSSEASRRGLCNTHRTYAYKMIKLGKTSEANLIKRRLLLPKASGGDQTGKIKKKKKTTKKKVPKKAPKKKTIKKRSVSKTPFPQKLVDSDRCLYPKCKVTRQGGGRGLCKKHYSQYKRKRNKLSNIAKRKLDRDLTRRHLLLPAQAHVKKHAKSESSAFEIGSPVRGSILRW